ncbi:MAG: bifunctional 3-(3-hydroxy-phenyl)propionate/3-hydroxycinnamic acid hydroxylase [Pseudomonadota bacterium]
MNRDPDVVIVGLGPVGGVLAALCGQRGLEVIVVERESDIYRLPRAVAMDHEVLRQLGLIGIADKVLAASNPSEGYEFVNSEREVLVARYQTGLADTGYPFANLFHQPSLETAIRERLAELPNVRVMLDSEVVGLEQESETVLTSIRRNDIDIRVRSRIVVGCDGGRSFVRRCIGSSMRDLGFDEPWLVVDVKLPEGIEALSNKAMQLCDPQHPTTSTQSGPGRHRWEFMLMPDEDPDDVTREASIRSRLAPWIDPETVDIERSAVYRFHGLIADEWRRDRVLIIGDAAHQMPPFLGQGLCSGVRDAFNLAWKLLSVIQDGTDILLLDTVSAERSPHVEGITEAAIQLGKLVCEMDPQKAAQRDRRFKADQAAGRPPPFPPMPRMQHGILDDHTAGNVLPEPYAVKKGDTVPVRLDELVGYVPLLIIARDAKPLVEGQDAINALAALCPSMRVCQIGATDSSRLELVDQDNHLQAMLDDQEALLVKPDRIVFGSGDIRTLANQWANYMGGAKFSKRVA